MYDVIYVDNSKKVWKFQLTENEVKRDSEGKMTLPDGFYSKGYVERISDIDWNDLPQLQTHGSFKLSFSGNKK